MKASAVICDGCGRFVCGGSYSRTWADAQRQGWIRGRWDRGHYCRDCAPLASRPPQRDTALESEALFCAKVAAHRRMAKMTGGAA